MSNHGLSSYTSSYRIVIRKTFLVEILSSVIFSQRKLDSDAVVNKSDPIKDHPQHLCEMCQKIGYHCRMND